MSVSLGVQLPDQPSGSGVTIEGTLGGPGMVAPHSFQDCSINLESDASAGTNFVWVTTDPRWTSVFAYATAEVTSGAAAIPLRIDLVGNIGVRGPGFRGNMLLDAGLPQTLTWYPPPFLGTSPLKTTDATFPFRMLAQIPNTDTENLSLNIRVYNFQKDIQQRVPLSVLFASLPRGGSST